MTRVFMCVLMLIVCVFALSACKPAPKNPYPGAENFGSQLVDRLRAQCQKEGGDFSKGGKSGGLICKKTPPDAGKRCQKASDCTTQCLARSLTCAPISPLFGCNDVLTEEGARVTLCIE